MSLQLVIPRRVALQQSSPPLHQPRAILKEKRKNEKEKPLSSVLQFLARAVRSFLWYALLPHRQINPFTDADNYILERKRLDAKQIRPNQGENRYLMLALWLYAMHDDPE
jgi:hypothetical protein